MIGKTIGQYQVIDKIGEGGMGAVYKAEDTTLHRLVALKTLSGHLTEDEEAQERFIREAQSASSLNHPNITTVYDFIEDDDTRLICMEYIEGKTIRNMVESGIVSVGKAIDIITQAAEALEAAHKKGILHRDVKSANIMVNMEGRVKVMDFGLAQLAGKSQLTRTGTTMGTLSYSSPEQISGRTVDRRSEVFSLGVVFYELLTGQLPFAATNEAEILFAIINNEPPKLSKLRDDVPELVEAVIARMLEKDPDLRYQNCGDVINDLKGIRKEMETSTVGITGVLERVQVNKRKKVVIRIGMGITVVVAIAVATVLLSNPGVRLNEEMVAVDIFENRTGETSLIEVGRIAASFLTESLRSMSIADVVPVNITAEAQDYLNSQTGESVTNRARLRAFAEETGAGVLVTGSYFQVNEELIFEVELISSRNMELISSVKDIRGSSDNPMEVIDLMRQRVAPVLASYLDTDLFDYTNAFSQPTSYEAWRLYSKAMDTFFLSQSASIPLCYEAHALAPEWFTPLLWVLAPLSNAGRFSETDSLVAIMNAHREELTPLEILTVDYYQAKSQGARWEKYRVVTQMAEIDSDHKYSAALSAIDINRPSEAVEYLEQMDPTRGWLRKWGGYWSQYLAALSMLDEHKRELKIVRWGQKLHPDWNSMIRYEAFAYAALGKVKKILPLLERGFPLPAQRSSRRTLAQILRGHGHHDAAQQLLDETIEWYRSRPPEEQQTAAYRAQLANILYFAEEWDESQALYSTVSYDYRPDLDWYLGRIAARKGDREEALRCIDNIRERHASLPYDLGQSEYMQATVFCLLGDHDRAINLLKEAHNKGLTYSSTMRFHIDLSTMAGFPPWEEFIRPKR
ncbi:protein kinase [Gemmatimonadota bacterium]